MRSQPNYNVGPQICQARAYPKLFPMTSLREIELRLGKGRRERMKDKELRTVECGMRREKTKKEELGLADAAMFDVRSLTFDVLAIRLRRGYGATREKGLRNADF